MDMIKAIIFDVGGVLSLGSSLSSFGEMYARKLNINPKKFNESIHYHWHKAEINEISSKQFWEELAGFLGTDREVLRRDMIDYFGFRHELLEFVKRLKKSYKLGLLSNHIEDWLEEIIEKHKLNNVFDAIITSYKSKVAKPDMPIYREVVRKLGVNPEECVFVDDLERNLPPAEKMGMKTILFRDTEQLKKELTSYGIAVD